MIPYSIKKGYGKCGSSEYAVVKDSDGTVMGCHKTKQDAQDQIAAIYANEGGKLVLPHTHLGRVHLVSAERAQQLYAALHERYIGEHDNDLFMWDAEISNDLLDTYYTHMNQKTLENYAADAQRGVAFLRGHDWRSLPVGYSVSGVLEERDGRKRVMAGFYTVRGLSETDDLIARMQAGLLRDVSVGFHGGRMVCDICGAEFWDCRHFPGLKFEEKQGDTVTTTLSTFTIDDARLSEVSGVFDGSTPEAMIRKAERMARAGELTRDQVQVLERRFEVALPASASFPGVDIPQKELEMTEEEIARIRAMLALGTDGDVLAGVEAMSKALTEAQQRIKSLEPQAQEGVQYRTDLIEEALAEGVRAGGAKFDRDTYETLLKGAPLATIKRMRDDWKQVADAILPAGRTSTDRVERPPQTPLMADSAYQV